MDIFSIYILKDKTRSSVLFGSRSQFQYFLAEFIIVLIITKRTNIMIFVKFIIFLRV